MMALAAESQNPLLTAALEYANYGWAVVPLHSPTTSGPCSCGRDDCSSPGKHPRLRHGLKEASVAEVQIAKWWRQWPQANIGIRTGGASGLLVLDIDPDHGGGESLDDLTRENGPLPSTLVVATGGGGSHFYFGHPGEEIRNDAGKKLGPGLDVRGDGGYVVAPPSLHASGQIYGWDSDVDDLAKPPDWLLERLRKPEPTRRPAPVLSLPGAGSTRYAERAFERELDELSRAAEGGRNHALNAAAFNLGQLVAGGELVQGVVEDALVQTAASIGLTDGEARATIASGLVAGLQHPRTAPEPSRTRSGTRRSPATANGAPTPIRPPREPQGPPPGKEPERSFNLTDMGNAERLVARHGTEIRYCHPQETWYVWDGRRWKRDATSEVERRAKETVRGIGGEAQFAEDRADRDKIFKHAMASESDARVQAMTRLARSEQGIPVIPEQLDGDPWLLNCLNGTVDLRTGELREHRREELLTKLAPVAFDSSASSELWQRYLRDVTGDDAQLTEFLQRIAGYTATGLVSEEVLFFIHGPAASGKSTFMEALKAALGEYATTADFETFLDRRPGGGPREDIARLAGSRLVMSIEVDEGKKLAEGLVKMITGGDTVTARHLYKGSFEFQPQFALWLVANHEPRVRDDDEAMWRRIIRVPFEHVVARDHRDPALKAKLRDTNKAGQAVLAWIVRGAIDWHRRGGLAVPESVAVATQKYRDDMDPLKDFLEDCCVIAPSAWASSAALRDAYEAWGRDSGERRLLSAKAFGERLTALSCSQQARRTGGATKRGWQGIGLLGEPVQGNLED